MIYFIQIVDGGPIKIGYTNQLRNRFRNIKHSLQCTLHVLGYIDGSGEDEDSLHRQFDHLRLGPDEFREWAPVDVVPHGATEWFLPGEDLLAFIGMAASPWDNSDPICHYRNERTRS